MNSEENESNKSVTDERNSALLKLQRKQRLESLIEKRKNNFKYLMLIHEGESYWLNSVLLDRRELQNLIINRVNSNRSVMFYYFAISLSDIVQLSSGIPVIKALTQLLEEWEYYFSSNTMQSMKYVMAKTSNYYYPSFMMPNDNEIEQVKGGIYKFNNDIVYEYLKTPHVPFELNYIEIFHSLCEMLYQLYDKFWSEDSFTIVGMYDAIVRLDGRMKHFIINLIAKELTDKTVEDVKDEISSLRDMI